MTVASWMRRSIAWLVLALSVTVADAQPIAIEVASFDVFGDDAHVEAVLQGTYDAQFHVLPTGQARLRGGDERTHWLRLAFELPAGDAPLDSTVLRFDRVPLDQITVHLPRQDGGWTALSDGFFLPAAEGSESPNSYAFALPQHWRGPQVVYVQLHGASRINATPRLVGERAFHADDRRISSLLSAIYASILMMTLSAFALFLALRDRAYLNFVGLTSCLLLLLVAINGHLYQPPWLHALAWWRNNGLFGLAMVCCALALGFTAHFLGLSRATGKLPAWVARARHALFALAAFCFVNFTSLVPPLQSLVGAMGVLTGVLLVVLSVQAWRRGEKLARANCLVWLFLSLAVATRVALAQGWLPLNPLTLYGFQVATAFSLFLMSIGLADRVMEFRQQRDHAKRLKEETDVSLQVEQVRRQFNDGLRDQLRMNIADGDLEWLAFKRLLSSLHQLVPQSGSAIVAYGYHGLDLLLAEPIDTKERYERLLAVRGGTLKGMCRSRKAVQVQLDESEDGELPPTGGLFAVVPMSIPLPGWGALLIERDPTDPYQAAELKLAADFLSQAVAATDEATSQAELKRRAELDPLTGACNRRAGELVLHQSLQRALVEREPFSLLFVDLDHFKQVNDRHGHAVGDECLRRAADTIQRELGIDDLLVRYGGEEFLVILPRQSPNQARQLGERIRLAVMQVRLEDGTGPVRFTVSIGVAGRLPGEERPEGIVERADRALYTAKRNGRNQVQVAQSFGYGQVEHDDEPPPPVPL